MNHSLPSLPYIKPSHSVYYRNIDIGVTQIIDKTRATEVEERIAAAQDYVNNVAAKDEKLKPLMELCKMNHENCAYWAVLGMYCSKHCFWISVVKPFKTCTELIASFQSLLLTIT